MLGASAMVDVSSPSRAMSCSEEMTRTLVAMRRSDLRFDNEFTVKLMDSAGLFEGTKIACNGFMEKCGSYLFHAPYGYYYCADMYPKQKLLFDKCKDVESALEIGVYMGHSLLIMLLANPSIKITAIDISGRYAGPAIAYLRKEFPKASIEFIEAASLEALPKVQGRYDIFHLDGFHKEEVIRKEFELCAGLASAHSQRFMFDDSACCMNLIKDIFSSKKVRQYEWPGCMATNAYLELVP